MQCVLSNATEGYVLNDSGGYFTHASDKRQIQKLEQHAFKSAACKLTRDDLFIRHVCERADANARNRKTLSADDFIYRTHFVGHHMHLSGLECFFLSVQPTQKIKMWIEEKRIWVVVWPENIHVYNKDNTPVTFGSCFHVYNKDNTPVTFESCFHVYNKDNTPVTSEPCLRDDLLRLHVVRCSDTETAKSTPCLDRKYQYRVKISGRHKNLDGLHCSCLCVEPNRKIKVWINEVKTWFCILPQNIEVFTKYGNPVHLGSISRSKTPANWNLRGLVPYVKSWLGVQGSFCIVYRVPANCKLSSILRKGNDVRESKDENNRLWRREHHCQAWRRGGVCMERHFLYTISESGDGN